MKNQLSATKVRQFFETAKFFFTFFEKKFQLFFKNLLINI
jgi:hypothetical protein